MKTAPSGWTEAVLGVLGVILVVALQPPLPAWQSHLLVWVPMVLGVLIYATRRRAHDRRATDGAASAPSIRWRITGMDVLVGLFVGLALRTVVLLIEIVSTGRVSGGVTQQAGGPDLMWVAVAILAPAVIAPVIEEVFYRGLVLPALGLNWLGIVLSAIVFAAVHLVSGWHTITAISTLLVGLVLGYVAVETGRLGAPILAHVTYNSSLLALTYATGLNTVIS